VQFLITIRAERADNQDVVGEPLPVVLVVEDDTSVRQPLVKFLQMRQYTVVTADTADEGLDAIREHRPAAAIVDLRLRRGSGREVVVSMPPDVPVIIFSGLRSESADLEHLRPHTRLVEKPYSLVMLMDTLEEMLEEATAHSRRLSGESGDGAAVGHTTQKQ
jgi:DNA-binding response OmpR family regulator